MAYFSPLSVPYSSGTRLSVLAAFPFLVILPRPPNWHLHLDPTPSRSLALLPHTQLLWTSLGMSVGGASSPSPCSGQCERWPALCCCLKFCWAHGKAAASHRGEAPGRHVTMSQLLWGRAILEVWVLHLLSLGFFRNVLPQLLFIHELIMLPRS